MTTPSLATRLRGHLSRAMYPVLGRGIAAVLRNQIPVGGCVIDTASPYITPTNVALLFLGRYEAKELDFIQRWLPREQDVVELGASIGVTTAHIARGLASDRRLICVEANPHLIPLIRANVERNAPGRALAVLNEAIDYSGQPQVQLQLSAINTNSRVRPGAGGVAVAATTLSALVARFELGPFTLVADIEGSELGLILNDAAALSQVQHLLIELHVTEHAGEVWSPERMRDALISRHGFRLRAARGPVYVFERPTTPA